MNLKITDHFEGRHMGPNERQINEMIQLMGISSVDQLVDQTVPQNIRKEGSLNLPEAQSEFEYLKSIRAMASKNKLYNSFIGQGYYGTITPSVILRNIFENPGWYTQYTPYQAEISQGRLEALLNYQTVITDLTGMAIANASLLDEATAAAEAMIMFYNLKNKRAKDNPTSTILVDKGVFLQTLDVMKTRAKPLNYDVQSLDLAEADINENVFAIMIQYPKNNGDISLFEAQIEQAKSRGIYVIVAADLLSLSLLTPPGEWGADVVVGSTQRFGVPMAYGGPHAGYFAVTDKLKRQIPGRIIGVSVDNEGNRVLRMALQTREQHIKREKATSNICTAQALLATMAGMYAVYHGPDGIKDIARRIHAGTQTLVNNLIGLDIKVVNKDAFFDTITIKGEDIEKVKAISLKHEINLFYTEDEIRISMDETKLAADIEAITTVFAVLKGKDVVSSEQNIITLSIPSNAIRTSSFFDHDVFHDYHTETKMMRYLKRLENMDISLMHSMIPLGSCTMKLNAATELLPVSYPEFSQLHPFVPKDQAQGYAQLVDELSSYLCEITGFSACSLQPNSGANGEYAGLLAISNYHHANGDHHRNIALIPSSAHGTNPASAIMAGMKVVVVQCDEQGNVLVEDLKEKAELHKDHLAALLVTYPSTHGVYEVAIKEICEIIHDCGGLVYMDGANMNAQMGLTSPGLINADVCHLNLHKTFAIPHGGGGPGIGPICVNEKLKPFLPGHIYNEEENSGAVSAAEFGSAGILMISHAFIRLLGPKGLTNVSKISILNANYIKARLEAEYPILYTGHNGHVAHELIVDLRPFKSIVSAEDVAKRLMDYGFHAPTLSFPVAGTIMIEPTESEDKVELDRFCDALLKIKEEIDEIAQGKYDAEDNVLVNAPHTNHMITADEWSHAYSRSKAAYPVEGLYAFKFWPAVARVNNAFGDRNLVCTCPPMSAYEEQEENA